MASGSTKKKSNRPIVRASSVMAASSYSSPSSSSSSSLSFRRRKRLVLLIAFVTSVLILLIITSRKNENHTSSIVDSFEAPLGEVHSIEVVNEFPHDPKAFTQGLLYGGNDTLYESTGLYKQSSVRKVVLQTGKAEILEKMDGSQFGEGLTLLGERLFQVTWLKKTGFVYDRNTLSKIKEFTHQMLDGWGLATDGKVLFGSDGSSTLYRLNPQTLEVIWSATVKYKDRAVHSLNELEYVNGEVWANVWMTDCIARISPKDGSVLGWILLPELRKRLIAAGHRRIDVLNGIAWDSEKNRLFVTGKLWPKLYEIKLHQITGEYPGSVEQLCMSGHQFHFGRP